jgi:signal transduction histidine kinase
MSLRLRLTLGLVLVNAAVLAAAWIWARDLDRQGEEREQARRAALLGEVAEMVRERFRPEDVGNLARMLAWPLWPEFDDALVLDTRIMTDAEGGPLPFGAFLNPNGARRRAADFPLREVAAAIVRATASGENVPVADGVAVPIYAHRPFASAREAWGGVFVKPAAPSPAPPFLLNVMLAGLAATALGALLVFVVVDRTVARQVRALAEGARRFGKDREATPVGATGGALEVRALAESFHAMMEEIRGFQLELERRVQEATARAAEAERLAARQDRLAALGILAAGLAHEINSPLAGALHSLEVLRKEAAGARGERYAALIEEALQRIRELVQRLLQMAPQQAIGGSCQIAEVVEDLRAFLAVRLQRHRLEFQSADAALRVRGARGDWFPLLLNLLQNALDALDAAGARAGTVRIAVRATADGGAEVRVRDDGPGAPPELLPHLFEPFVSSKDPGKGTGLGLALAHATVRSLRGSIEAVNLPGGGFEVVVRVPPPAPEAA